LREKGFILAMVSVHGCFGPMMAGTWGGGSSHLMLDKKQKDRELPSTRYPEGPTPSYLLLPARSHFLMLPETPILGFNT
jgi:hypothetical protein